ncbi:MAG TPA: lipopolysaccharide biosynthesis protein [Ignavibacteriales bacterium]|nr:lipopolysaccharide biosynthesis protein [Ignavibacteriales bacterium]
MGIVIRQSAKTLFVTYLGFLIGYVNTLILYPLALSVEQIGLQRILIDATVFFASFAALGATNIPLRYFPYFRDPEKEHNGFLFFLLTLSFCGYIIFVILFLLLKNSLISVYSSNALQLTKYYYYLIPFTLIQLMMIIFEVYTLVQLKPVVPRFIREIVIRVLLALGVLGVLYKVITFNTFVDLIPVIYLLAFILLVFYVYSIRALFLRPNFGVFKSPQFKGILVFGGFVLLGNSSDIIIRNIDSLMLSSYSGLRSTGIYTIALYIALVLEIPRRSMAQVVIPLVAEATKNGDVKKIDELYKKSSLNQMIIGGLLFLVIWCNIDNIFKFIPNGNTFAIGKWVVFYLGLSKVFDMAMGVNAEIVTTSKYYKYDIFFYAGLSLMAIGTNMLLIPVLGLTGASIATAISIFVFNSVRFVFIWYIYKIQPFTKDTLKVLAIAGFMLLFNYMLPHMPGHFVWDVAVRGFLITVIFSILILFFRASEDINSTLARVLKRYLEKVRR